MVRSNSKSLGQVVNSLSPIVHRINWAQLSGCGKFWIPNGEQSVQDDWPQVCVIGSKFIVAGHLCPRIVCPPIHIMYESHESGAAAKLCGSCAGAPKHGCWLRTATIAQQDSTSRTSEIKSITDVRICLGSQNYGCNFLFTS